MVRDPRKPYKPPRPRGAKLIPLTQGQWAIVDADLYEWLMQWKWCAAWSPSTKGYYAVRHVGSIEQEEGSPSTITMHRAILGLTDPKIQGDHVHHRTLDNRMSQLKPVTHRQNQCNRKKEGTSKYPNVHLDRRCSKWQVRFQIQGLRVHMGYFTDEDEAGAFAKTIQDYIDANPNCTAQDLKRLYK